MDKPYWQARTHAHVLQLAGKTRTDREGFRKVTGRFAGPVENAAVTYPGANLPTLCVPEM